MKKAYLIAFITILRKEMTRFLRIWSQTILPPAITAMLYFIIFGTTLGKQIGATEGYSYLQFIVPGLILMAVISNAYSNVVSSFFGLRFSKSIEELLVAPVPYYLILLGFIAGGMARGIIVGFIVILLALFFTHLHIHNLFVLITVILLAALLFSLAGFANGLFARKFDDTAIIPTFVLTPLTYLGGVFYSTSLLPHFWYHFSLFNPILYIVNGFRYGMLGISDVSLESTFAILVIGCIGLFGFNLYLLKKGAGIKT